MSDTPLREVVAFDFDGTLTRGDTLLPFLRRLCGTTAVVRALAGEAGSLATASRRRTDRDGYKAAVLGRLLAGWAASQVDDVVEAYTEHVLGSQVRPDSAQRVAWHRDRGHELVVVSASPELYVGPIARRLGFAAVLATRLEVVDGKLTGRLVGANVRGAEKLRRLHQHLDGEQVRLWAYGDSAGDRELLAAANVATRVTRARLVRL